MESLTLKRVSYGKESTPKNDREYLPVNGGPVGTFKEWKDYAQKNNVSLTFKKEVFGNGRK